jgi:hypothetical protein
MRPCTRELSRQKSSLERRDTPYDTNTRKTNFPTQSALDGVVVYVREILLESLKSGDPFERLTL